MSEPRPVELTNLRDAPVRVLTFVDAERRTPGPSIMVAPGETARIVLPIAGFRVERPV